MLDLALRQSAEGVAVGHRFRLEERLVDGEALQTRYRYRASVWVPVAKAASLAGSAEAFLRGVGREGRPVFDRYRLFVGAEVRATAGLAVRAGVLEDVFTDAANEAANEQVVLGVRQSF